MRNRRKGAMLAVLFMVMFLGILVFIAMNRPGSLVVMAYCFAVPGIVYITKLLFSWIVEDGRHGRV